MNRYILSVCILSCGIGVIENLTDGTRVSRQIKFILSLIMLMTVFSPLADREGITDFANMPEVHMSEEYSAELYNNQIKSQVSSNVSAVLGEELSKNGISYEFIETEVNISQTNCIFISKVTISTDNFERAEKIIKENLGEEIVVLNEDN